MKPGARFLLPSGRVVQVLGIHHDSLTPVASCGYVDRGRLRSEGIERKHRVSLRTTFLARFGRPTA